MGPDETIPEILCPACAAGPCVCHAPLFAELHDMPGIPAGQPPRVHETPEALPHRRPRRRPALHERVDQLEQRLREVLGAGALPSS